MSQGLAHRRQARMSQLRVPAFPGVLVHFELASRRTDNQCFWGNNGRPSFNPCQRVGGHGRCNHFGLELTASPAGGRTSNDKLR